MDLPGHGKSGSPRETENFRWTCLRRRSKLSGAKSKADKIVLVGHSMGTPVIRQYARLFRNTWRALVLVDGTVLDAKTAAGFAGIVDRFKGLTRQDTRRIHPQHADARGVAELQARIEKMMTAPPDSTAAGAMAAMADPGNLEGRSGQRSRARSLRGKVARGKSRIDHEDFPIDRIPRDPGDRSFPDAREARGVQ